ncbi:MAG TPA: DarT ssDNA thymidine ADP-ribosyltransferase family protein [Anaerolineaceae bacterium]
MLIPEKYQSRSVYHFTPIANLPMILSHGLLSVGEQERMGIPVNTMVGNWIRRYRHELHLPIGPSTCLDDYVSFYFCKLSPMLLAIIGNKVEDEENIIHFEFPIDLMRTYPSIFTDAAAIPSSSPRFFEHGDELDQLNWDAIDSPSWRMPSESLRNARLAELLFYRKVSIDHIQRIIVWDELAAQKVKNLFHQYRTKAPKIETDPGCYFIDPHAKEPVPAIRGPGQIYREYLTTIHQLKGLSSPNPHGSFRNLEHLREALWMDMNSLKETSELVGLETDNRAHVEDVGAHTYHVACQIRQTTEYQKSDERDQRLLEISAFLHDIGKGPKQRWTETGGKQQLDYNHPWRALPMLERIFREEIREFDWADAALIIKLVAYHDLIGGIMVSGRKFEELLKVIIDERELDMLIALSKADASAINPSWLRVAERAALRQAVIRHWEKGIEL